jgi:hypothetical protein
MQKFRRLLAVLVATGGLAAGALTLGVGAASADYGPGALYQVEITANQGGLNGGGIWLWIALYPTAGPAAGTGDYSGSDCGHSHGAASDMGEVAWVKSGANLIISGVVLNGFGPVGVPVTITVPSAYGHYPYPANAFTTIFTGLPPFVQGGSAQVQVAP